MATNRIHRRINRVFYRIIKGRGTVGFELDGLDTTVFVSMKWLNIKTGLTPTSIETIVGSTMRVSFYKKGEEMLNHNVCTASNRIVRDFYIEFSEPLDGNCTLTFKKITSMHIFTRNGKESVCIKFSHDDVCFVSLKRILGLACLKEHELNKLIGSWMAPEYYEAGEQMNSGMFCRKSKTIVKELNLRLSGSITDLKNDLTQCSIPNSRSYANIESQYEYEAPAYTSFTNDFTHPSDNPYYNDALDMDQQSIEFWNSL